MTTYEVIDDPAWGFKRLDPIPDESVLGSFYQSRYADLLSKGGRGPDLRRLMTGGPEAAAEREWLAATTYTDIKIALERAITSTSRSILDVGCGTGEFVEFMQLAGWHARGVEPSVEIAGLGIAMGRTITIGTLESFLTANQPQGSVGLDAVTLLNVLEHVPDPAAVLRQVKTVLTEGGLIVIRVPNDFNELQLQAQKVFNLSPWWVAIPDHINYFDRRSLTNLLTGTGYQAIYVATDFPMEAFLLMGDMYVGNASLGRQCHERRRRLEMAISGEVRRRWYRHLARADIGRNLTIVARAVGT